MPLPLSYERSGEYHRCFGLPSRCLPGSSRIAHLCWSGAGLILWPSAGKSSTESKKQSGTISSPSLSSEQSTTEEPAVPPPQTPARGSVGTPRPQPPARLRTCCSATRQPVLRLSIKPTRCCTLSFSHLDGILTSGSPTSCVEHLALLWFGPFWIYTERGSVCPCFKRLYRR